MGANSLVAKRLSTWTSRWPTPGGNGLPAAAIEVNYIEVVVIMQNQKQVYV
jgi:hypothetical protein